MRKAQIHISNSNTKMGKVPSFSLTPGVTCSPEANETCFKLGCYANRLYKLRKNMRKTWDENTYLAVYNLKSLYKQLENYFSNINTPRYFRIHVGGDFFSVEYYEMWLRIAKKHPDIKFLAFTKQFEVINMSKKRVPKNMKIILSEWEGIIVPDELRAKYKCARVIKPKEAPPEGYKLCSGKCDQCGLCWDHDENVAFKKH